MSLWAELKRRNVVRVAIAYVVTAWVLIEVSSLILDIYGSFETVQKIIVALLALGLPFAVLFAWVFEVTPEGIKREKDIEHEPVAAQQTAKRLDVLTIGMVMLAIALLAADRFFERPAAVPAPTEVVSTGEPTTESKADATSTAQQILEINRLKDLGKIGEAFNLTRMVVDTLDDDFDEEALWAGISWSVDLVSDPPGASVYRQPLEAGAEDWEYLGDTPLENMRFADTVTSRVRFELEGHRPVEVLQEALEPADRIFGQGIMATVQLDTPDSLPEEMVRIPGFTLDLVEYSDYFMDRLEVTNRDFSKFVAAGGYSSQQYWTEPFTDGDETRSWEEAMALFADRTGRPGPANWSGGSYPSGQGDWPVSGISWFEAMAYAQYIGKTLPTWIHHAEALRFFDVNSGVIASRSNFAESGPRSVGENRAMNTLGLYDQVGNVREWCRNPMPDGQRCIFGAAWNDVSYMARDVYSKPAWDRDAAHGMRLVKTFDSPEKIARLSEPETPSQIRDYSLEVPASDVEFEIYRRFYSYDPLPLNARIEEDVEAEFWRRERVSFDLPGGQRGAAFIYIPKHRDPPFETVLVWPGSNVLNNRDISSTQFTYMEFLIKSGRAVALPVFWGTLDRDDPDNPVTTNTLWDGDFRKSTSYRDLRVTWVQEMSRTIDYLETRSDIKSEKLGFYGLSWGGFIAPIALAIEADRIDAAVLAVAGLTTSGFNLPETDPFNFITRVRMPVLMINGEYDAVAPRISSQLPMYEWLGTEDEHKKMFVAPSSHLVPLDILIRESLDWYDRYLGSYPD